MHETVGIVALAFGQAGGSTLSSGIANQEIIGITSMVAKTEHEAGNLVSIVSQWETAVTDRPCHTLSERYSPTHYLSTAQVLTRALDYLQQMEVDRLILVGHPHHLRVTRLVYWRKLRRSGMKLDRQYDNLLDFVPYDASDDNVQAWTHGPVEFAQYLFTRALIGRHGA